MVKIQLTLRDARKASGLTQQQLARRLKVTQPTIVHLEHGITRSIDLGLLARLCVVLDKQPKDLLRLRRDRSKKGPRQIGVPTRSGGGMK